jgi:thiamine-phosphate pyrophosphorylase
MTAHDLSLYFVTDPRLFATRGVVETAVAAAAGGATLVQLRDPHAKGRDLVALARALVAALAPFHVPLIINDRPDVAFAAGAHGVHLGQDDLGAADARDLLGPNAIIGISAGTPEEMADVPWDQIDHVGIGPVFTTATKGDAGAALGVAGLAALVKQARKPAVAIGGLSIASVTDCIRAGADGVAVVSAIAAAADPHSAARDLKEAVMQARRATP